jgi:hypothetical protein
VLQFDGEYVRSGRYDSVTRHLMVQATAPKEMPADRLLLARLSQAVGQAVEWFRHRGVAFNLPALRALIQSLE